MIRSACALALLTAAFPAAAQVTIDAPMGAHAVVQQGAPIPITGSAPAGAMVRARLGGSQGEARADPQGRYQMTLPPLAAGGPYRLDVTGGGAAVSAEDVQVGDVWLCSGQSNMELPVSRALNAPSEIAGSADAQLRLLTVPQRIAEAPQNRFAEQTQWRRADPESVVEFSAACYFMGRALRGVTGRAVGLIDASWGGSRIRPWMPVGEVAALPAQAEDLAMLRAYRDDRPAALQVAAARWQQWWSEATGEPHEHGPWAAPERFDWQPVPQIAPWERWGVAALAAFNGTVWFERTVELTPGQAAGDATLELGNLDEMDAVWWNGEPLAAGFGWADPRSYPVAADRLRPGTNRLVVAVNDSWGEGGFHGPADVLALQTDAGRVPLGEGWRWAMQAGGANVPPRTSWESHAGISGMYNGMIAPLGGIGLAGVAWYQGESDVGTRGYADRLAGLMRGWRRQFAAPDLPFLIVSLAGYGAPAPEPVESDTAALRDAQRRAAAADARAALVTAVDLGDRQDIHPANKAEVGRRLARAARALAYGEAIAPSGPEAIRAERDGGDIRITVRGASGGLVAWSAAAPIGFELCGVGPGSCRFAEARIEDGGIRLPGDGASVARVRYGWADMPVINLYDAAELPLGPFELPVE